MATARQQFIGAVTASLVSLAAFGPAAGAQDSNQLAAVATQGKAVLLEVGRGFNENDANLTAAFLNKEGCPTKVANGGPYKRVKVTVGEKSSTYPDGDGAAAYGLLLCKS